jgi:hypothetical protein
MKINDNGATQTGMFLTADQLAALTGRMRADAQRRELDHMEVPYRVRRDGTLAVLLVHVENDPREPGRYHPSKREPQLRL